MFHESYQNPKMRHDLALVRLDRPIIFDTFVSPICMPEGPLLTMNHKGSVMEVAGWGVHDMTSHRTSTLLLHVRVPIVNPRFCDKTLGKFASVGPGQLCAGGQIGFDSCGGDSGGPLMKAAVVNGPPKYYVIGVVSFGAVNCGSQAPAVYTDVAYYMNWILDRIEP
jgi:secreted trypsin-like serine protease